MYDKKAMGFEINRVYRHWKGKLYYVKDVAIHTETDELMVIYQTLYGEYKSYVRPYRMFIEKVPEGREDENITGQKYRFEPFEYDLKKKGE